MTASDPWRFGNFSAVLSDLNQVLTMKKATEADLGGWFEVGGVVTQWACPSCPDAALG